MSIELSAMKTEVGAESAEGYNERVGAALGHVGEARGQLVEAQNSRDAEQLKSAMGNMRSGLDNLFQEGLGDAHADPAAMPNEVAQLEGTIGANPGTVKALMGLRDKAAEAEVDMSNPNVKIDPAHFDGLVDSMREATAGMPTELAPSEDAVPTEAAPTEETPESQSAPAGDGTGDGSADEDGDDDEKAGATVSETAVKPGDANASQSEATIGESGDLVKTDANGVPIIEGTAQAKTEAAPVAGIEGSKPVAPVEAQTSKPEGTIPPPARADGAPVAPAADGDLLKTDANGVPITDGVAVKTDAPAPKADVPLAPAPETNGKYNLENGRLVDPVTHAHFERGSMLKIDEATNLPINDKTGNLIDRARGFELDKNTQRLIPISAEQQIDPFTKESVALPDHGLEQDAERSTPESTLYINPYNNHRVNLEQGWEEDSAGHMIDLNRGLKIDPESGHCLDAVTSMPIDRETGFKIDLSTNLPIDPQSKLLIDKANGVYLDADTQAFAGRIPGANPVAVTTEISDATASKGEATKGDIGDLVQTDANGVPITDASSTAAPVEGARESGNGEIPTEAPAEGQDEAAPQEDVNGDVNEEPEMDDLGRLIDHGTQLLKDVADAGKLFDMHTGHPIFSQQYVQHPHTSELLERGSGFKIHAETGLAIHPETGNLLDRVNHIEVHPVTREVVRELPHEIHPSQLPLTFGRHH